MIEVGLKSSRGNSGKNVMCKVGGVIVVTIAQRGKKKVHGGGLEVMHFWSYKDMEDPIRWI